MIKAIQKGFTLIELLVVITIIGILATGAVTTFTSQIQKARDTTRISDIGALKTSVEQAYQDSAQYPDATAAAFTGAISDYIEIIPSDPKEGQGCKNTGTATTCYYAYNVSADNGIANGHYELSTAFEANGNLTSKAANSSDSGNDEDRLEQGTDLDNINTGVPANENADQCAVQGGAGTALLVGNACN